MRYHWCPRMFPWRHWESLWRNNLTDLESVKGVATRTIFVAIDTEPWLDHEGHNLDDKEAREIGIAFLSPSADQGGRAFEPPRTLAETYRRFAISSHCIRIRGRQRLSGELFWNGSTEAIIYVEPDEVEETIVNLLQSTQKLATAPGGALLPLTFVGFDLHAEFRILANQYPCLLGSFTSWVDVQELCKETTALPQAPSLRNSLVAFGFDTEFPTNASRNPHHNAGNDSMRTISVLVHLLHYPPRGHELAQTCSANTSGRAKQREHRQREKINMTKSDLFAKRYPHPREKYPFRAKVDLPGASFTGHPDAGILCE
ncbi:hypothetical protein K4F52_001821 [Lecanicillium sp. MT-2017a]|nr:hypothetical protein K4F52_001821 [Lecanicillium sp. MT-2017a]